MCSLTVREEWAECHVLRKTASKLAYIDALPIVAPVHPPNDYIRNLNGFFFARCIL